MTETQAELIPRSTGERLRQRRRARKFTLAQVAAAIHFDEQVLRDIEADGTGHVAAIYRKGYIRAYARYLGFTEAEIEDMLRAEQERLAALEPSVQSAFSEPPKRRREERWLRATSYVLASLLIGTLAWQFSREAVRLSQAGAQSDKVRHGSTVERQQKEARGDAGEPVNASIAPLGALHAAKGGGSDPAEQAWASISAPALPPGYNRLRVSVSADSWVEITDGDGKPLEMDLIRAGNEKVYQGPQPYKILLGRASAVRLFVNGERVDLAPFTRDNVARLSWPIEAGPEDPEAGRD